VSRTVIVYSTLFHVTTRGYRDIVMSRSARRKELVQLENELLAQISPQDDNVLVLTTDSFDKN
jgi:hypothetical protein